MEFKSKKYGYTISDVIGRTCKLCIHKEIWEIAVGEEECLICKHQKGFNSEFCVCNRFESANKGDDQHES